MIIFLYLIISIFVDGFLTICGNLLGCIFLASILSIFAKFAKTFIHSVISLLYIRGLGIVIEKLEVAQYKGDFSIVSHGVGVHFIAL